MNARLYISTAVQDVIRLHADLLREYPGNMRVIDVLERQSATLLTAHRGSDPAVAFQIRSWLPGHAGRTAAEILAAPLSLEDMRLTVAREHGFDSWEDACVRGNVFFEADFEAAVDAAVGGRLPVLERLIFRSPHIVEGRSPYGHRATLLHYVAANGVETWRQTVPRVAPQIVRYIISAGGNPNATAHFYGGDYTPSPLVATSSHPANAGLTDAILAALEGRS